MVKKPLCRSFVGKMLSSREPTNIFTENLEDVRFLNDREAYTIARAPIGADIPLPTSINNLEGVLAVEPAQDRPPTRLMPTQDFGVELD